MPFSLTDEQRQVQDTIRRVARDKVAPRAAAIDAEGAYPQDMYDLLCDLDCATRSMDFRLSADQSSWHFQLM